MTKLKVLVIGTGNMGYIAARDLIENNEVTEVVLGDLDLNKAKQVAEKLKSDKISVKHIDVMNRTELVKTMKGFDAVVNCVWHTLVYEVTKAAIEAGVNCLDLGGLYHYTLKQLGLNDEAKRAEVTYIVGCGLSPGITNVMAKHGANKLDQVDEVHIRGGSPSSKEFKLKFVYTPRTYLEQFTKNAIIFQNGEYKTVPPGSGREVVRLPEPFNQDVEMYYTLHSELATLPHTIKGVKNVDVRLAYTPEMVQIFKIFANCNLTSEKPIKVKGVTVTPFDVLTECLSMLMDKRGDRVWMAEVIGEKNGKKTRVITYCISLYNEKWDVTGVGYATGVAASIGAQWLAKGEIKIKGVVPPEECIVPERFFFELAKRGIPIYETIESTRRLC
jgi:saccharopine dehydrogenase (NAD+, L-lysine-forming)